MEVRELKNGESSNFYFDDGVIGHTTKHYINKITVDKYGFEHNINDEPAFIILFDSGNINSKWWFEHGKEHRLTGPSYIEYNEKGEITNEMYYIYGKELDRN